MRTAFILLCSLAVVFGQLGTDVPTEFTVNAEVHPYGSNICALDEHWSQIDKSNFYKSSFGGIKKLCVKDYLQVCASPTGLVTCNGFNAVCMEVQYDWTDANQYPLAAGNMNKRPEVCSDLGQFRHPDTAVVLIAQIVITGVVMIAVFILLFLQGEVNILFKILAGVFLLLCLLLNFSYYYLNSVLIFSTVVAASFAFSYKSDSAAAVGFALILGTLFWTTYQNGLGYVQHQSRFTAGGPSADTYEKLCNSYYRGYFFWPAETHHENDNIAVQYNSLCNREWLSGCLFFMIFAQQLLVILIAAGARVQFGEPRDGEAGEVKVVSVSKQQE